MLPSRVLWLAWLLTLQPSRWGPVAPSAAPSPKPSAPACSSHDATHLPLLDCARTLLQVPQRGSAWTCTQRAPMAADGTIYTCHWLYAGSTCCLHVQDLIAKVIHLDAARSDASSAAALDRSRVVYETEWQTAAAHTVPHATDQAVSCLLQCQPVFVLNQPGLGAQRYAMPRVAQTAAGSMFASGAAVTTCTAQTVLLQTVAAQAGRGSSMQLLTQGAQPVARAPTGSSASASTSAPALSMQSMMRVAAMEFGMVQWAGADAGLADPQPLPNG